MSCTPAQSYLSPPILAFHLYNYVSKGQCSHPARSLPIRYPAWHMQRKFDGDTQHGSNRSKLGSKPLYVRGHINISNVLRGVVKAKACIWKYQHFVHISWTAMAVQTPKYIDSDVNTPVEESLARSLWCPLMSWWPCPFERKNVDLKTTSNFRSALSAREYLIYVF
jgi:hypothetical protein